MMDMVGDMMVDMIGDMIEDMMGDINGGIIFYDIIIFQMHFISLFSHLLIVSILFSISNHKANTTELHPKVRKTCFSSGEGEAPTSNQKLFSA